MTPLVATWTEAGAVRTLEVDTPASAVALFDELHHRLSADPSMVEYASTSSGRSLVIGAGRVETVVTYQDSLDPPYFISAGEPTRRGEIEFWYSGEPTQYAAYSAVPVGDGRVVLIEYLAASALPASLRWERL